MRDPILGIGNDGKGMNIIGNILMQIRHEIAIANSKALNVLSDKRLYRVYVKYMYLSDLIDQHKNDLKDFISPFDLTKDDVKKLSPYLTEHIKRFGDYIFQMLLLSSIPDEIRDLQVA